MHPRGGIGDAVWAQPSCASGLSILTRGVRAFGGMTSTLQRVADLRLRSSAGPTRTRVWWPVAPGDGPTGLLLVFVDAAVEAPWLRELASLAQLVIVAAPCAP